jgi:hypothetical protein
MMNMKSFPGVHPYNLGALICGAIGSRGVNRVVKSDSRTWLLQNFFTNVTSYLLTSRPDLTNKETTVRAPIVRTGSSIDGSDVTIASKCARARTSADIFVHGIATSYSKTDETNPGIEIPSILISVICGRDKAQLNSKAKHISKCDRRIDVTSHFRFVVLGRGRAPQIIASRNSSSMNHIFVLGHFPSHWEMRIETSIGLVFVEFGDHLNS